MRLGLMGGTFDPIHCGHVRVARAARDRGLERVLIVPAGRPPHKDREDIVNPFHRFALAALATFGETGLGVSAFEVSRDLPSYSIDTVSHYVGQGHEVSLIMGTDSLLEIETWRSCRELLDAAAILAYPRPPDTGDALENRLPGWVREHMRSGRVVRLDGPVDETSSTQIRRLLAEKRSIRGLVPEAVEAYIRDNSLYTSEGKTD